jgi:glycosyltransferase involved in cell wall biosynthesis
VDANWVLIDQAFIGKPNCMVDPSDGILESPLVTIVTPSFNQVSFLEATIQSVLSQDYPKIEYILVDGGSQDGSLEIIKKYADRFAYWVSEQDRGHADALNKGFSRANGKIWAWLNSDDTYYPEAVSRAVRFLVENPDVGMVYGDADLTDDQGNIIGEFAARQTDYYRMLEGSVHIPQATTFIRASVWQQIGELDLSLFFGFDYDLWVKISKITKIKYLPQKWATFRLHGEGKSIRFDDRCYPDMLQVRERELGKGFSKLALKAWLRPIIYTWLPLKLRVWLRRIVPW